MKLKNILIVVKDIEKSRLFYHDLFGLGVIQQSEDNVILTEGLVLQKEKVWKDFLSREIFSYSNSFELYFEERNIDVFLEKLERLYPDIQYVSSLDKNCFGRKVVRFYDLDGNMIEVGEAKC